MVIVKCRVDSVSVLADGGAKAVLTFTDPQQHSWQKEYDFHQTDPIDINAFVIRVTADIRKDMNISVVLDQLLPYVGQTFDLSV